MSTPIPFNNLFPDLNTCKQFQEMGLFKGSIFVWSRVYGDIRPVMRKDLPRLEEDNWLYCCPTTDEMLAELPAFIPRNSGVGFYDSYDNYFYYYLDIETLIDKTREYRVGYRLEDEGITSHNFVNISLPQALAELYLKLKAEKII